MVNKNPFNLHKTYQERRRDGPYDVLATLKCKVPNPTPNWRKMSEIHKISEIFFVRSCKRNYEQDNKAIIKRTHHGIGWRYGHHDPTLYPY